MKSRRDSLTMIYALLTLLLPLWAAEPFRFHLLSEPPSLDPQTSASASGNYLFHNIYRSLFRIDSEKGLVPDGAEKCAIKGRTLTCRLRPARWSDGSKVTAAHYVQSFRRLIDPNNKSPQSEILFGLKNARAIWDGRMKPESLGVEALSERSLRLILTDDDPEIEYRLAASALSPLPPGGYLNKKRAGQQISNGPYRILEWTSGGRIRLAADLNYGSGNPKRPPVEAVFVDDDSTALRLYETGKLDFLRRLVASEIPRFKGKPEFHQIAVARFDYVGFGPALDAHPKVREALTLGVDYEGFLKLFDTKTTAGCPSLPSRLQEKGECLGFDPVKGRALAKNAPKLEMHFSRLGGDDIARAAEWFQGQWKKNLGLAVELKSQEQTVYLSRLRAGAPPIFRKGVSLDRPTCLAALEIFTKGNPENFIRLDDAEYEKRVQSVRSATTESERKAACSRALSHLLKSHRLIPLGEMYFTILAKLSFKGWKLNELNQLDLSHLSSP